MIEHLPQQAENLLYSLRSEVFGQLLRFQFPHILNADLGDLDISKGRNQVFIEDTLVQVRCRGANLTFRVFADQGILELTKGDLAGFDELPAVELRQAFGQQLLGVFPSVRGATFPTSADLPTPSESTRKLVPVR